ncbi:thioredoxin family protein [Salinimicrobium sp. MT39]|uniref:Thioredoxin family protein n=1 Tax=Salinimicrobium profundisediminis TaxID=2994553 RepID=A0A9X3I1R6_9FLAO|nr:thioredoxin family protein [Salinimicrobium profundisediminis]MCX2838207.1 thioredoxin family protein [Salinimicrobium profundisediminis]
MKIFLYLLLLITASNCGNTGNTENEQKTTEPVSQEEEAGNLIGEINFEDLQQAPYSAWFDPMYQSYKPGEEALSTIKENINEYDIMMFMGTWCADSQREVPKFYKLLELSDYDLDRLQVMAVREDKTLPNEMEQEYDVIYVPTIIFFKDGEEVGRFVEYPQEELEDDIAKIVSGQEYKHSYE